MSVHRTALGGGSSAGPAGGEASHVETLRCELPVGGAACGTARGRLRGQFADQLPCSTAADAELVLTELVANAVAASADVGIVMLTIRLISSALLIEVFDESEALPSPRCADDLSENGRGLQLVEVLTQSWGWHPVANGKIVWGLFLL